MRTAVYQTPRERFYTPHQYKDPWGNITQIGFTADSHWMLPQMTTDALGNTTRVNAYDWNTLQPLILQDANDNISEILYDALGMPVAMAVKGKDDGTEGDTLDNLHPDNTADTALQHDFWDDPQIAAKDLLKGATWRCVYDWERMPAAVGMITRERHHVGMPESPLQIQISYSDGMGRVLMQKVQCEPTMENADKHWVGTGRTVYNNKGREVMQYEPYFSDTHHCDTAEQAAAAGVSPRIFYDPLDRNYRTELPDGSFLKTEWTAWEQQEWDNNDTVLESEWYAIRINGSLGAEEQAAAEKAAIHANTPTIILTDTLARGFYTIQDDGINPLIHSYEILDIPGNRLAVVGGRGLTPLSYAYNMFQSPCYQHSIDSGTQRTLVDAAGQLLYAWDAEDRETEIVYDALRRPLKKITDTKELEVYVYGEGLINAKAKNLREQLYQNYGSSGMQQVNAYDFKGNPLETEQQLLEDATISDADWSMSPPLSTEVFITTITYDALNRPITSTDPGGNVQSFSYDEGGLLKTIALNSNNYVNDIHYNAQGQRKAIWYGNGTKTSYSYDKYTFRLRRLLTVNLNNNEILQDLHYWYDPVGNITEIQDDAQQTIFFNNSVVSPRQQFTYDALYRLIQAQGRELIGTATFGSEDNWNDAAWKTTQKGDGNAVQNYTQLYTYDAVGNILELQHIAAAGSYTRAYEIASDSNQLLSTTVGTATYTYQYDARGNMATMPHLDGMYWNLNNELHQIENGTIQAYYQYSGGQRIRKYVAKGNITEERIYLGSFEIYRKFEGSSLKVERQTVHVSDDTGRIAMLEKRTVGSSGDDNGTDALLTRYIYPNHLQSASLELDETGDIISYEEYHPYGTTSYQATNASIKAVAKRYRYCSAERDEESGLYYFSARFYIPWLCRWASCDPINSENYNIAQGNPQRNKERDFIELCASPYEYAYDNPVNFTDETGEQPNNTEIDEKVKRLTDQYKKMIWDAKSVGANVAAGNLQHFLDGTGTSKIISASWLRNYSVIEKGEKRIKGYFTDKNITKWSSEVKVGQTIQRSDYWIADIKSYNPFNELSYASGASKITANGAFELTRTDENNISVSGIVTMNWKDPYDWHEGLGFYIPGSGYINDKDAQFLEEHGNAKSFDMLSAWQYSFSGTYNLKTGKWSNMKWEYMGQVSPSSSTTNTSGSTNGDEENSRRDNRREYRNDREQRRAREDSRR